MKIKHILYIILLVFSLVPLYLFGTFMIYENDEKIESIMRENLAAISGTQILDIKTFCDASKERLDMITQYKLVRDTICTSLGEGECIDETSEEYLKNILLERKNYSSNIESISIVDRDFRIVISTEPYDKDTLSDLANVGSQYLTGDFHISNMYERETEKGNQRLAAAFQGVLREGEVIGYVVEEINTSYFDKYRSDTNLWKDGTLYIVDGKKNLITAGYPGEKTREEFVTNEMERADYKKAWESLDREKNPSGEFSYEIGGVTYITYYSNLDYTEWVIQVTVNLSSHLKTTKAYRILLLITVILISLLLIVINYLLTRRLTRPIDQIAETLERVQDEQNYTLRVENCGKDELGQLSAKVNKLLEYIEQENIQEKEQQRFLARKAERDPLTGVKNKKAMEERMQDMAQRAMEEGSRIAVGFLDIDDFRDYNTNYGHQEGDHVIQFVASVLAENVNGVVGRNGGDEFVFCIGKINDAERVEHIVKRILQKLNEGMYNRESGTYMPIPCSIGVVVEEGKEISYSSLIRCADEAMYQAKQNGKNTYQFIYRSNQ